MGLPWQYCSCMWLKVGSAIGYELIMNRRQCSECKSEQLEPGKMFGGFYPDNPRFLAINTQVSVKAAMCKACGHIDLSGDVEELNRIIGNDS